MATSLSPSRFLSLVHIPPSRNTARAPQFALLSSSLKTQKITKAAAAMASAESADCRFSSSSSSAAASFPVELTAVMNPSAAYANILFFKSAYNVQVIVDENEPEERLLNRFRREVMKAGVIQECKRRRFFENKQEEKKRKTREAAKRNRRRRPPLRSPLQNKQETSSSKKDDEEEDNWDMPEDLASRYKA